MNALVLEYSSAPTGGNLRGAIEAGNFVADDSKKATAGNQLDTRAISLLLKEKQRARPKAAVRQRLSEVIAHCKLLFDSDETEQVVAKSLEQSALTLCTAMRDSATTPPERRALQLAIMLIHDAPFGSSSKKIQKLWAVYMEMDGATDQKRKSLLREKIVESFHWAASLGCDDTEAGRFALLAIGANPEVVELRDGAGSVIKDIRSGNRAGLGQSGKSILAKLGSDDTFARVTRTRRERVRARKTPRAM